MGDGFVPHKIFNAILHSLFSAATELAPLKHTRRPTPSGSLKKQIPKAKSSMVTSSIPQNLMLSFLTGLVSFSYLVLKHLGRLTSSASLEDRTSKAKSSMVTSSTPKTLDKIKGDSPLLFSSLPAIPQNLVAKRERRVRRVRPFPKTYI